MLFRSPVRDVWARHAADGVATVPLADVADRLANSSILYAVVDVEGCVEINQCVGCTRQFFTKSFPGDDATVER